MKNKQNKKIFSVSKVLISLLLCLLLISANKTQDIFAANNLKQLRNESVYVGLDNYGEFVKGTMYVDTILNGTKLIKDFGKFSKVENMTNKIETSYDEEGNLIWDLTTYNGESFAYNVELDKSTFANIPWTFDISYQLNGVDTDPNLLAHKTGLVKITVHCIPNKNANKFYLNNYMMEVTADFDLNDYVSVVSNDALETITGKTKTLTWIVLPGQDKTFDVMLGTEDFKYDGLTFGMVPLTGEISEKVVDLIEDKKDLEDAYNASMNGTDVVLDALGNMTTGLNEAASGLKSLRTGTIKMHDLKGKRDITVEELDKEVSSLSDDMDQFAKDVEEYQIILSNVEKNVDNFDDDLEKIEDIAKDFPDTAKDIRKLIKHSNELVGLLSDGDPTDIEKEIALSAQTVGDDLSDLATELVGLGSLTFNPELGKITGASDSVGYAYLSLVNNFNNLASALTSMGDDKYNHLQDDLSNMYSDLKSLQDNGDVFIDIVDDTEDFLDNIKDALKVLNKKDRGMDVLTSMVSHLSDLVNTCNDSIPTIKSALDILSNELYDGAINTVQGLQTVTNQLANVSSQAQTFMTAKTKVDKVIRSNWEDIDNKTTLFEMDPNATKISFSSDKNVEPNKIQIFIKSPEIKEVIDNDLVKLEAEKVKENVWTRIVNLFIKMWNAITNLFK